jgi:hypothetical protein
MSNFIINNNHPIIQREQYYFLDRRLVTIHSVDRDINKWTNSNNFEIELPNTLNNVYSIRLLDINIPNFNYTFSKNYQNTKFSLKLQQDISGGGSEAILINNFYKKNFSIIEIDEGYYTPIELANEIQNKLNFKISNDININYDKFKLKYDNIENKIFIINTRDNFTLYFNKQEIYNNLDCGQKIVWKQYANWGLPYNLGYEKQIYQNLNTENGKNLIFSHDNTIFVPDQNNASNNIKYSKSINYIDILGYDNIYMELDKYNSIDEIRPYSKKTNNIYNNDYNGSINSVFAKLPITKTPFNSSTIKNSFLNNITFFKVPIPTIKKLKFKFRFHDGVLVDFKNVPFSFTLEINQLIDEQHRAYSLNIPYVYKI